MTIEVVDFPKPIFLILAYNQVKIQDAIDLQRVTNLTDSFKSYLQNYDSDYLNGMCKITFELWIYIGLKLHCERTFNSLSKVTSIVNIAESQLKQVIKSVSKHVLFILIKMLIA